MERIGYSACRCVFAAARTQRPENQASHALKTKAGAALKTKAGVPMEGDQDA